MSKEKDLKLLEAIFGPLDKSEPLNTQRDQLAKAEGSPYHETSKAREMAFKNGWDACLEHVMNVLNKPKK